MENKEVPMTIDQLQEKFYQLRDSITSILVGKGEVGGKPVIDLTSIRLKWYGENQFTLETCVSREPNGDLLPFCKINTYEVEYVLSAKHPDDWVLADPDIDEKIAANCVNDAVTIFTEGLFKEAPVKAPEVEKEEKNDFFKKHDVYRCDVIPDCADYPVSPMTDTYLSLIKSVLWSRLHITVDKSNLTRYTRGTDLAFPQYDVETKACDYDTLDNVYSVTHEIEVSVGFRDKMCQMVREYRTTVGYVTFTGGSTSGDPIASMELRIEHFVREIVKHLSGGDRAESK